MDDFLLMMLAMEDDEMEAKDELDELHFEDDEDDLEDPIWVEEQDYHDWTEEE